MPETGIRFTVIHDISRNLRLLLQCV